MNKLERRIKSLVRNRPGITAYQMMEYLSMNPSKIQRALNNMKQSGMIVGKRAEDEEVYRQAK